MTGALDSRPAAVVALPPLATIDSEQLACRLLPGPGSVCVVLAHGFSGSLERPALQRIAAGLQRHTSVLAYDARGHGRSTGRSTLGHLEVLDVDAAVARAREHGQTVITCGFSMGGAAVVRHGGLHGPPRERVGGDVGLLLRHPPDAVAAVSTTADWTTRAGASRSMRRLHRIVETRAGRLMAARAMGTRVSPDPGRPRPASPRQLAAAVAPRPLLVVHGDRDAYFPLGVARALAAAAGPAAELWEEAGFAHGEQGMGAELLERLARRLATLAPAA